MNQIEIAEQLKDVPDQYLLQEVQQPTGNFPAYLVVSEMTRRKRMRQAAAQPAPTTTVVEDLAMGAQQPPMSPQMPQMAPQMPQQASMGLGAMPQAQGDLAAMDAGVMPEQRIPSMAGGGMVSFKQGGEVEKYQQGGFTDAWQRYQNSLISDEDPLATSSAFQRFISPSEAKLYERAKLEEFDRLAKLPSPSVFTATTPAERYAYAQRENLMRQLRQGKFDPTAPQSVTPPKEIIVNGNPVAKDAYNVATAGRIAQEKAAAQAAAQGRGTGTQVSRIPSAPVSQMPYQAEFDKGIAAFLARQPMTEEQLMAARAAGARQYEQEMPDRLTPMMEQEIAARQERLGKEKGSNLNTALMQAGLAIMGNRSPYGMQAIGQGGLEGLKTYREGKKDIEQGEAELTKARIAAAQAQSLYAQGKYAAGDKALDRANDIEAKALAKQQSDLAVMASAQDRAMAQAEFPYKLREYNAKINQANALSEYYRSGGRNAGGASRLSDGDQKAAEDAAKSAALMQGFLPGTPQYKQLFDAVYMDELMRRAAGVNYIPQSPSAMQNPSGFIMGNPIE